MIKLKTSLRSKLRTKGNIAGPMLSGYHLNIKQNLKFDPTGKCINAFQVISDPLVIKVAYGMIKSKPGNMTEGTDNITLDGISNK